MQLQKIFRDNRSVIIMTAIILFSLAGFVYGVVPLVKQIIVVSESVSQLSADIAKLEQKSSVMGQLDETTLRDNLLTLVSAVPPDKSLVSVLSTVDGVAGDSGVTLVNLQLSRPGSIATQSARKLTVQEAKAGANILSFSAEISGTYDQVRAFLSKVASVRRYFHLVAFDISFIGTNVAARMDLEAYYAPYPTALGDVTSPISPLTDKEKTTLANLESYPVYSTGSVSTTAVQAPITGGKTDPFSL